MSTNPPNPTPRSRVVEHIVSRPGAIKRLRSRRLGLDYLVGRPPMLELYYEPGDPHSHLAAQLLPRLQQRLRIPLIVRVVGEADPVVYPEADKQRAFALNDASRIASVWGLSFPEQAQRPGAEARRQAARILLAAPDVDIFCASEAKVAARLFSGQPPIMDTQALSSSDADAKLASHKKRRAALGHYLPGMWQLNGNWYWGIDRLEDLLSDLQRGSWIEGDEDIASFKPRLARLPELKLQGAVLEFFYSFRSPYSYLAVEALQNMVDSLPVPLRIRPVLPMAMRGMKIPPAKGLYIARDVYRQARKRHIAFGRIADPLGLATQRCLTLFNLLNDPREQLNFLQSNSRAVWSEGIDVANDEGLRFVWERAGLRWSEAEKKLAQGMDLTQAETNRQALFEAGLWGVPSFRLGEFVTWGNDRIWMLQELLHRQDSRIEA